MSDEPKSPTAQEPKVEEPKKLTPKFDRAFFEQRRAEFKVQMVSAAKKIKDAQTQYDRITGAAMETEQLLAQIPTEPPAAK